MGHLCKLVRMHWPGADPEEDGTDGFFVACFERKEGAAAGERPAGQPAGGAAAASKKRRKKQQGWQQEQQGD